MIIREEARNSCAKPDPEFFNTIGQEGPYPAQQLSGREGPSGGLRAGAKRQIFSTSLADQRTAAVASAAKQSRAGWSGSARECSVALRPLAMTEWEKPTVGRLTPPQARCRARRRKSMKIAAS